MASAARAYKGYYYTAQTRPKSAANRARRKHIIHRSTVLIIALLSLIVLSRLIQEVLHAQTVTQINQHKAEIEKTLKQKEELEYKLTLMKAPGRIKSIAVNKLGMVEAKKVGYLLIPDTGRPAKDSAIVAKDEPRLASAFWPFQ